MPSSLEGFLASVFEHSLFSSEILVTAVGGKSRYAVALEEAYAAGKSVAVALEMLREMAWE